MNSHRTTHVPGRRTRALRAALIALPGLWVLSVAGWELLRPAGPDLTPLLAAAPALACAGSGRRCCVLVSGGGALLVLALLGFLDGGRATGLHLGVSCAVVTALVAACLSTGRGRRLLRELERTRAVAVAAQQVLLRPLPAAVGGFTTAVRHLSATRGASVGGDLYEALVTPYGVRIVVGDVRGHGLAAIGTVAAVLGCFREAAHAEPDLAGVLRRLDRALGRHLREGPGEESRDPYGPDGSAEEFVTVLLLELRPEEELSVLNCGHPWPYRLRTDGCGGAETVEGEERAGAAGAPAGPGARTGPGCRDDGTEQPGKRRASGGVGGSNKPLASPGPEEAPSPAPTGKAGNAAPAEEREEDTAPPPGGSPVRPLSDAGPLPPLGAFPLPDRLPAERLPPLRPGELLLLHTDGAEDARDAARRFFPLARTLETAVSSGAVRTPEELVDRVEAALLRHTGGRLADDVALLAIRRGVPRVPSGRTAPESTGGAVAPPAAAG
ncbi:PP2C family protein-serine/threonine phosphatase [Streptomyces xinghaiensis]|uniref:PP2C family protein-serine/threonine phosphatase n=1 Tax=Streptomyces xinghaiensis TaxID=1038928 RepID=UPI002E137EE7|nr:serine/threonine-protein phosphatase [Streptomyces xinghaiensis]